MQSIDLANLNELAGGDSSFIREIIEVFLQDSPGMMDTIRTGMQENNLDAAAFEAHKLKSNLRLLGATRGGELAEGIEHASKSGDFNVVKDNLPMLELEIQQVTSELQKALKEL